jgi:putative transposase
LRAGSSVVQQQVIRDFGRSRAKAHKDIAERLAQDLLEGCSRRRPEPGISSLQGGEDSKVRQGRLTEFSKTGAIASSCHADWRWGK